MVNKIVQLLKEEDGQSMVEYGIIIALISVVAVGTIQTIGSRITNAYGKVDNALWDNAGFAEQKAAATK